MNFKYNPQTLKKLESLFEEIGYVIRYEKGNFQSGYCLLEDKQIAVINKFLNIEGRMNVMLEILPTIEFDKENLSTEGKEHYQDFINAPLENE